jgi:hypothetical protein
VRVLRELPEGARQPRGWRLAWHEHGRRVGIYLPMPLHWLAWLTRELRYRISLAWEAPSRERKEFYDRERIHRERQRLAEEFARGYLAGWQECFLACKEAMQEEFGSWGIN